jgi:LysM repeat protein
VPLKNVAKILSVSSQTIEALNPELRFKMTPPGPYDLKVPEGKGDFLLSKLNRVPASNLSQKLYTLHRVHWGETLVQLASRYRTSVHAITGINHIKEKDFLRVGQKLKIPLGGTTVSKETEGGREMIIPGNPRSCATG